MLSLVFKTIYPSKTGGVHTTRTHPITSLWLEYVKITKSQALKTEYYGHPVPKSKNIFGSYMQFVFPLFMCL